MQKILGYIKRFKNIEANIEILFINLTFINFFSETHHILFTQKNFFKIGRLYFPKSLMGLFNQALSQCSKTFYSCN